VTASRGVVSECPRLRKDLRKNEKSSKKMAGPLSRVKSDSV
jgi:hypothetical protein